MNRLNGRERAARGGGGGIRGEFGIAERGRARREGGGQGGGEGEDAKDREKPPPRCRRTDPTCVRILVGRTDGLTGRPTPLIIIIFDDEGSERDRSVVRAGNGRGANHPH